MDSVTVGPGWPPSTPVVLDSLLFMLPVTPVPLSVTNYRATLIKCPNSGGWGQVFGREDEGS